MPACGESNGGGGRAVVSTGEARRLSPTKRQAGPTGRGAEQGVRESRLAGRGMGCAGPAGPELEEASRVMRRVQRGFGCEQGPEHAGLHRMRVAVGSGEWAAGSHALVGGAEAEDHPQEAVGEPPLLQARGHRCCRHHVFRVELPGLQ